jgi:hypothetical protein
MGSDRFIGADSARAQTCTAKILWCKVLVFNASRGDIVSKTIRWIDTLSASIV